MAAQNIEGDGLGIQAQPQSLGDAYQPMSAANSAYGALRADLPARSGPQQLPTPPLSPPVKRKPVGSGPSIPRKSVSSGTQDARPEVKSWPSVVQPTAASLEPTSSGEAVVSNIQRVLRVEETNKEISATTELAIQHLFYADESQMSAEELVVRESCRGITARIIQEPELFMEVRNLILNATAVEILKVLDYLETSNLYVAEDRQEAMDWADLIRQLRENGPFVVMRVLPERLTDEHHVWACVARTILLDPTLTTKAQYHSMEPGPNAPINKSFFKTTPISFPYDYEEYQRNFEYRYWIGERTLGLTNTTTLDAYRAELTHRYRNRERLLQPFVPEPFNDSYAEISYNNQLRATKNFQRLQRMAENANVQLNTTGWTRNPGLIGPPLGNHHDGYPKLPEMHTGVAGEHRPDDSIYIVQTKRWPMARNWTMLPELVWFPLSLPSIIRASDFRLVETPEMLFTDRFGVTMRGVSHTQQCTAVDEHDISTRSIAETVGYDAALAAHGLTYTDYRRCIVAILYFLGRNHADWLHQRRDLKQFFYDATQYLRSRGVPVVIKFKFVGETGRGTLLWAASMLSIRHHPFSVPVRGKLGKRF